MEVFVVLPNDTVLNLYFNVTKVASNGWSDGKELPKCMGLVNYVCRDQLIGMFSLEVNQMEKISECW